MLKPPPNLLRKIARRWLWFGLTVAGLISAAAVAHYCFGMPVHDRDSGKLLPSHEIAFLFAMIGGGGCLFSGMGAALLRWIKPE